MGSRRQARTATPTPATDSPHRRALIFISHDSRDADLAEAFENLLTDASGGVLKAFRSSDRKGTSGIEFGAEWYATIMSKLDEATEVVALLTTRSMERPWILYEVGVARGKLGKPAFGLAVGVSLDQIAGPFAQFQNSGDDEDSLTKLVLQLIRRNPDAAPREEAVRRQVAAFRERIPATTSASISRAAPSPPDGAAIAKLFEEVKVMFRALPDQLASRVQMTKPSSELFGDSAWTDRGHDIIYHRVGSPTEIIDQWQRFMMFLGEKAQVPLDAAYEVWQALESSDRERLRLATDNYRDFVAKASRGPDKEFAHMAEHGLELLERQETPSLFAMSAKKKRRKDT